ncbi:MAG: PD-(D/E)XK nuclease family protein [Fimbriimonadia bacterium]|nr:PD-(D/E)XK nuclease family protein [Fimbriimonadia bacterium]
MKLILGPSGSGKTEHLLSILRAKSKTCIMGMPDSVSVERIKKRLVRAQKPLPAETLLTDWNGWLARMIHQEKRRPDTARAAALCARICERALNDQSFFGKARSQPSFHQRLVHRFEEWELRGLTPEVLLEAAQALPESPQGTACGLDSSDCREEWLRKTSELVDLWQKYRARAARAGILNDAQKLEIAIQKAQSHAPLPFDTLLLDGFQTLPALTFQLLDALQHRSVDIFIALTCDETRPDLFVPTLKLKAQLEARFQPDLVRMETPSRFLNPMLSLLESRLWNPTPPAAPELDNAAPITIIDAPSVLAEVETVAREIIQKHAEGVPYEEMAILARTPENYALSLPILFERYEIPLQMEVRTRLIDSPTIRALISFIDLVVESPHPEPLFDWLRIPLVMFPRDHFGMLKQGARKLRDPDDWRAWLETLRAQGHHAEAHFLKEWLDMRQARHQMISEDQREQLEAYGKMLIQRLIPLQQMKPRDQNAMQTAQTLMDAYIEHLPDRPLQGHLLNIKQLWQQSSFSYSTGDKGVPVTRTEDADLGEARIVFVIGALEGAFPRRHPDDPFLREEERIALTTSWQNQIDLTTETENWESERFRFYRAATAAREQFFFSAPRASGESDALPSFYLQDVERALPETGIARRFLSVDQIQPDAAKTLHPYDEGLRNPDHHWHFGDTLLNHPRARQWASQINRAFSVTELETLMKCPFQHLAQYRLKARSPRGKLHVTEIGTLLHDTLRRAFTAKNLPTEPAALAQQLLDNVKAILQEQQEEFAPWQILVISEYCARLLKMFAERESLYLPKFGLIPTYFEWSFGQGAADEEEQGERARDPHSKPEPLTLGNGKTLRVCGIIDRIDMNPQGDLAMLIDYKTGSPVTLKAMEEGESIQMPVYAMAFQDAFKQVRLALAYDSLSDNRRYRILPHNKSGDQSTTPLLAEDWEGSRKDIQDFLPNNKWIAIQKQVSDQIARIALEMEQAEIAPRPGDHCKLCAYSDFCRSAQLT